MKPQARIIRGDQLLFALDLMSFIYFAGPFRRKKACNPRGLRTKQVMAVLKQHFGFWFKFGDGGAIYFLYKQKIDQAINNYFVRGANDLLRSTVSGLEKIVFPLPLHLPEMENENIQRLIKLVVEGRITEAMLK